MLNSLGLPKPPQATRVVVAMSGGVDSSTVAGMLAREGYDVVGITLQLYDYGMAVGKKGACCAGQDIYDAGEAARKLGIPHYVLDYESRFRQEVIDDFVDSYANGETPIPCVKCNQTVKFRDLLKTARELNADVLATGHYVQRRQGVNGVELHKGSDPKRDQSYFLFGTTRDQLAMLHFPLGGMPKQQTRELARHFGLEIADKPDSQDICFVPDGDYAKVVGKLRPSALQAGDIVTTSGEVIGQHQGIIHYTIGQRRGLGVSGGEPLYVLKLDAKNRRVIVGSRSALGRDEITVRDVNWLGDTPLGDGGIAAEVRVRSTRPPVPAMLYGLPDGRLRVVFAEPEMAIAPGQAAVFYQDSRVLGGGWIERQPAVT